MQPIAEESTSRLPAEQIREAIERYLPELSKEGVIALRPGYQFTNGWVTKKPAIIAFVRNKGASTPEQELPRAVGGVAVDVRQAPPHLQLDYDNAADRQGFPRVLEAFSTGLVLPEMEDDPAAQMPYRPPQGVALARVNEPMRIRCSVGPDAGFPELKAFLESTGERLTIGMYEFSVTHILDALLKGLGDDKPLEFVLDSKEDPGGNITEVEVFERLTSELEDRLSFAWAAVRGRNTVTKWVFPSAYHIKVAVKDGTSFWLSSGNWTRSSQPDKPTQNWPSALNNSNREWHVVVEHKGLAQTFEAYLRNDLEEAAAVQSAGLEGDALIESDMPAVVLLRDEAEADSTPGPPVAAKTFEGTLDVAPLLTPDNFMPKIMELLESATQSIFIQTQYLTVSNTATKLKKLVALLKRKQDDGIDLRMIFRGDGNGAQEQLEVLVDRGIEPERVKFQRRVHNKGILVDGKAVVIGSQNWSESGVTVNRDASLIIRNSDVAKYYRGVFLHDWTKRAKHFVQNEGDRPLVAEGDADALHNARLVSWAEHYAATFEP